MNLNNLNLKNGLENTINKISPLKESKNVLDSFKNGMLKIAIVTTILLPNLYAQDINQSIIPKNKLIDNYLKLDNNALKEYNLSKEVKLEIIEMFNNVIPFEKYKDKTNDDYILDFINKVSNTNFKSINEYFSNITIEEQKFSTETFKNDLKKIGHPEYFEKINIVFEDIGKNTYLNNFKYSNQNSLINKDKHTSFFLPNVSEISKSVLWEFINDIIVTHKESIAIEQLALNSNIDR